MPSLANSMPLEGKVALVLGAIKGIGKGIALDLARQGAAVVLTYWDWEESLEELKQDFEPIETPYWITKINLLDTSKIPALLNKIGARYGRLDILINNIERGGWPIVHGPYVEEQWDLEMATTLRAKRWVFESALPYLKASGNGLAVNFSSIAALVGRSGPASLVFNEGYAAANRGISLLTETWARMGAPEVRVNEIMLGIFNTRHGPGTRGWGLLSEAQKEALRQHTLLERWGSIPDIIKAIHFLVHDAPFMTGSVLRLDGGYLLGGERPEEMPKGVL